MARVSVKKQPKSGKAPPKEARFPYLPGLDGLRALAVMAVLLYHADLQWIPGGFLGVEVFFVISGYLITALLLTEWRNHHRIDLKAFWIRRARRLLPALYLLLAATMLYAVMRLYEEVASLRGDVVAAVAYVTNWYLIFTEKSYFEVVGRPSLLRHLWSLAVEEQFYVFWPVLIAVGLSWWRRRWVLAAIIGGAVASTLWMAYLYTPDVDASRVYYGTDTRAAGFLIGAALAFIWAPDVLRTGRRGVTRRASLIVQGVGLAALVALLGLFVILTEYHPYLYLGGFAAVALATAVLIGAVVHPAAGLLAGVLGWGIFRWIGQRSYGIYLWHWPIYMVTRPQLDVTLEGLPLLALRAGITFIAAELSYRLVEMPIRRGALGRAWQSLGQARGPRRRSLATRWGTAVGALSLLVFSLAFAVVGAPDVEPPEYLQVQAIDTGALPAAPVEDNDWPASGLASAAVSGSPVSPLPVERETGPAPPGAWLPPAELAHEARQGPDELAAPMTREQPWDITPPSDPRALPRVIDTQTSEETALRQGPDHRYAIERGLPRDEPVAVQGKSDNGLWYQVQLGDAVVGWLPATAVVVNAPTTSVPIVALSTPPTGQAPAQPAQPPAPAFAPLVPAHIRVSALGDSVMLGAVADMQRHMPGARIDAAVSRQASNAIDVLRGWAATGQLAPTVVIHVGNNGALSGRQVDEMMGVLGDRRVILLTTRVPRGWQGPNNDVILDAAQRYGNLRVVDWYGASVNRPDLFWQDGIHLRPEGSWLYTQLIANAILGR